LINGDLMTIGGDPLWQQLLCPPCARRQKHDNPHIFDAMLPSRPAMDDVVL
jgi:hypothetical protein